MRRQPHAIFGGRNPCVRKGGIDIARFRHPLAIGTKCARKRLRDRPVSREAALRHEFGAHGVERPVRRPPVCCNRCDPAFMLDNIEHTEDAVGSRLVDRLQEGIADRPLPDRGIDHVRQADIGGIIGRSIDLCRDIEATHTPACEPVLPPTRTKRNILGKPHSRRFFGEFAKAQPVVAARHEPAPCIAGQPVGIPALRGRLAQQCARGRPRLPGD